MSDNNSPFSPKALPVNAKTITMSVTAIAGILIGIYFASIIVWDSKDLILGLIIIWCSWLCLSYLGLYYWGKFTKNKALSDLHLWVSLPLIVPIFIVPLSGEALIGIKSIPFFITISLLILENSCFKLFGKNSDTSNEAVPNKTFSTIFFLSLLLIVAIILLSMKAPNTSKDYRTISSYPKNNNYDYTKYDPPPTVNFDQLPTMPTIDWDSISVPTFPELVPKTTSPPTSTPSVSPIVFVFHPETAYRNQKVSVKIKGEPHTLYCITVTYSSGQSTAAGLQPKESDAYGYVSWTWKVGGRTESGIYPITVEGGGASETVWFKVKV